MKSITLRGIDSSLERKLKQIAKEQGKSVNQVILDTLKTYQGLAKDKRFTRVFHDMDHLFGRRTEKEFETIQGKIDEARRIDPELWQ